MKQLPDLLHQISWDDILRIDVGLEGNWNPTVVTVWEKGSRNRNYSQVAKPEGKCRPSIELYFPDRWIGIHCYIEDDGKLLFDTDLANQIIDFVESKIK